MTCAVVIHGILYTIYHYFVSFTTGKYGVLFRCQSRYILIHTWKSQSFCMWMFLAVFMIAKKNCTQSKCSSTGKWINKPWHILTIKYYTTIERNSMNESQKYTISERSQTQKAVPCIFHLYESLEKVNL